MATPPKGSPWPSRRPATPNTASSSPAQYRAQFAPAQSDVDAVYAWLRSQGLKVGYVPDNRKYVEVRATVAQAAAAFSTTFSDYTVDGTALRSNDTPLSVPRSLTGVASVIGLDETEALVHRDATYPPPAGFRSGEPCSAFWAEKTVQNTTVPGVTFPASPSAFAPCGYAGAQLQGTYGVSQAIASAPTAGASPSLSSTRSRRRPPPAT